MKNIDLAYLIPMVLSLLSFIGFIIIGKKAKDNSKNVLKYIPLFSVVSMILGVFIITNHYQNQLEIEKQKFLLLQHSTKINDSVFLDVNSKKVTLDSLKKVDLELKRLLKEIKKQERIVGENSNIKENINEKIVATNEQIGLIESYNEIIETPKNLKKGYMGVETSNFIFNCPTEKNGTYLDLKLRFQDEKLLEKISCLYVEVTETKENGQNWLIFNQAYAPRSGVNAIKIKNYLKNKNVTLEVGYFLKSQTNKEFPDFNRITCK